MTIRFRLFAAIVALLAAVALPVYAKTTATRYECEFKPGTARDGNWVPSVLVIQHEDGADMALVFDPIIKFFHGKPIDAKVGETTKARREFSWKYRAKAGQSQDFTMSYSFVYYTSGKAKITARPGGFDNSWSGDGTCKVTKG